MNTKPKTNDLLLSFRVHIIPDMNSHTSHLALTDQHESQVSRRLNTAPLPEVREFIYAPRLLRDFERGFESLVDVNQAHLLMLFESGLLQREAASALARVLMEIEAAGPQAVVLDPGREDAYFNFENHLIKLAGSHLGGTLHMARSRNDILATQDRMRARVVLLDAVDALCVLQRTLLAQALRYADVVMTGYTHLQPAQPITYGYYLEAVAQSIARDTTRLSQSWHAFEHCPLGAGALAGTAFPIRPERNAGLLGFSSHVCNALDAVASRDFALEMMSSMTLAVVGWSRVAQDYFVWSTNEFGLIEFPDSVAGSSSIMPQKKNPVVLEYLKGKGGQLIGLQTGVLATVKTVNFTHTGDGNREAMSGFWPCADEFIRAAALLEVVVRTAEPRADAMLSATRENFCTATDLADLMVREKGISFREAHHIVGAVVSRSLVREGEQSFITPVMIDDIAKEQIGRALELSQESIDQSIDPLLSVASRASPSGPAPDRLRIRLTEASGLLESVQNQNRQRRDKLIAARSDMKATLGSLAESGR